MKDKFERFGEIRKCYIEHLNENRTERGKKRPVMIVSEEDGLCTIAQVTTSSSPFNIINGYKVKDWENAGLDKPSYVNCHPKDTRQMSLQDMESVGRLSLRDQKQSFVKMVQVADKTMRRNNQLDKKRNRGPENDGPEL
ncbi:type II toxin-antitoxin system PemK/MazF family toxin [Alkalicoccobacillus gibsonii]|jgi:hypothetical protein|uniref:type II toxin-antitoxin system PemK/MazF family toxin n=1 Tax=Alkalicoccobacillus gibsonii TaxID=79881 RepID=UPI0019313C37|nr:type II toxin-antitoxin system PemK/MazF family toxin [Alkalicoccobacillus gibsonii]MBM0067943.1 type II toxin-antitoxin system PemK/MazF family toxin [Alkalicoccobacillus gibsonii]